MKLRDALGVAMVVHTGVLSFSSRTGEKEFDREIKLWHALGVAHACAHGSVVVFVQDWGRKN